MNAKVEKTEKGKKIPQFSLNKIKTAITNLIWVIKEVAKLSLIDLLGLFITSILNRIAPLIVAYYSSKLIDMVIKASSLGIKDLNTFLAYEDNQLYVFLLILTFAGNFALSELGRIFDKRFWHWDFRLFDMKMQRQLATLDVQQFEDAEVANAMQKSKDVLWKIFSSFQELIRTLADFASIFVSGAIVFALNPWLILFSLVMGIPQNIFNLLHIKRWWNWYETQLESNRKMWWLRSVMLGGGMEEHKVYESNLYLADKTEEIHKKNSKAELGVDMKRSQYNIFGIIFALPGYFIPAFYVLSQALLGNISIGQMGFYTTNISNFSDKLNWIIGQLVELYDMSISISSMRYIFELKPVIKNGAKKVKYIKAPVIEFRNVSFKYPKATRYALKDVNLTIKPGEEIAIVGENGAGKSTFIRLLLRFYDVTSGEILINGVPIEQIELKSYYQNISALFQDYLIYQPLNVSENIAMGRPFEKAKEKSIIDASKLADASKFINDLDNKYEQVLNKNFSGGVNLSTGQWQKLALARLFYKNAPILILDEPTSSIDAVAESKIFNRIYSFMKGKSVIIISHRFSTVRKAKKIYVFNGGKIVEAGSHIELMKLEGKYFKAYNLQAKGYGEDI